MKDINQIKVTYTTLQGGQSTAYLSRSAGDLYEGSDKYTDHDVVVESTDEGWLER